MVIIKYFKLIIEVFAIKKNNYYYNIWTVDQPKQDARADRMKTSYQNSGTPPV